MEKKITAVLDTGMRLYTYSFPYVNEFKWTISNLTGANYNFYTPNGKVLLPSLPRNVYKIQIQETRIPKSSNMQYFYRGIRCHVLELPGKTYMSNIENSTQIPYHFEFKTRTKNNYITLIPEKNEVVFNPPLKSIDSLTLSFYDPFNRYYFDMDNGFYTVTFGIFTTFTLQNAITNPLNFGQNLDNTILDGTSQIFSINSGATIIIITPITSNTSSLNSILNRPEGFVATKISSTSFTIPIDTSANGPYVQSNVFVYYQNFRFNVILDIFYKE